MKNKQNRDAGLLIIRLVIGTTMLSFHGIPKITGGTAMLEKIGGSMKYIGITFYPIVWGGIAAGIEIIAAAFFILGFKTKISSGLLAATMVIATLFHLGEGHGLAKSSHTIELFAVFIAFCLMGAGKFSIDKK